MTSSPGGASHPGRIISWKGRDLVATALLEYTVALTGKITDTVTDKIIIRKDVPIVANGECKPLLQSCGWNSECCSDWCLLGLCI
jgi:hypothetical protein